MSKAGQLIVFEGADGVGKSSISSGVSDMLRKRGNPVELLSFPGKIPHTLGELVYRLHHAPNALGIDSVTSVGLQTMHIAAHLDSIENTILPILETGTTLVLDRYWWSTFVYGVADGIPRDVLCALIQAEKLLWGSRLPTVLFYVARKQPLRAEPLDKWLRWSELYRELVESEKNSYPIDIIENEVSLQAAISSALARLDS
jgi:thymidylate kinase